MQIIQGDCIEVLKTLPDQSVQTIVTSPPYYGLRDYGTAKWEGGDSECDHNPQKPDGGDRSDRSLPLGRGGVYRDICAKCGAIRIDDQIGLEPTPDEYVSKLVSVFREVKRVLRDDGTLWLNLGDSYNGSGGAGGDYAEGGRREGQPKYPGRSISTLKPKDLIGIPWMVAFALRADGWYLRSDIIWCLSGGAYVYAKTQKGEYPMMVRDMVRLDPSTVKLWNGEKWTQVLGWSKSARKGDELEIVLRSGERISCTPTHKFPTNRGLLSAGEMVVGDELKRVKLPQPEFVKDCAIDESAAWFAGLYIAEGSREHGCIQIAGHVKEEERWQRVQKIATQFGGSATRTIDGNMMNIRVYGKVLNSIIDLLVTGKTSHDKGFSPVVWQYSNRFIKAMVDGYLSGDGHWDKENNRWRLGFTRNYNLERDLRTACARLGYHVVMNLSTVKYKGKDVPTFRGEIRFTKGEHHNNKSENEIIEIRKSRCREVYDVGVEDEPHVFALASGILTHNSKPNPMPESVKDRPTKSHEYIFLLAKSQRYYYDNEAVKEKASMSSGYSLQRLNGKPHNRKLASGYKSDASSGTTIDEWIDSGMRNRRSVWTVTTKPYREAHFATFPPDLIEPCVLAGCPAGGVVLDPFNGSGTTGAVALKHGRDYIGIELNPEYIELTMKRLSEVQPRLEVE